MTNTIKQILGEDIPGSEDTDVTGDEFDTVSRTAKCQHAADDLALAISHAFEQKLVVAAVTQLESAADAYVRATGLAAIPEKQVPRLSRASPWGTGYLDKVWANVYRAAFYYDFDNNPEALWYARMLINITNCYAVTLRHEHGKAF